MLNLEVKDKAIDLARNLNRQADLISAMVLGSLDDFNISSYSMPERARFERNRKNLAKDMLEFSRLLYDTNSFGEIK